MSAISAVQTLINQISSEGRSIESLDKDPFWDSLVPASNTEPANSEGIRNNQPCLKKPEAEQNVLDDFDIQGFKS